MTFLGKITTLSLITIALFACAPSLQDSSRFSVFEPTSTDETLYPFPTDNDSTYVPSVPPSYYDPSIPVEPDVHHERPPVVVINPDNIPNDPHLKEILKQYGSDGYYYYYYQPPHTGQPIPSDNDDNYVHPLLFN